MSISNLNGSTGSFLSNRGMKARASEGSVPCSVKVSMPRALTQRLSVNSSRLAASAMAQSLLLVGLPLSMSSCRTVIVYFMFTHGLS